MVTGCSCWDGDLLVFVLAGHSGLVRCTGFGHPEAAEFGKGARVRSRTQLVLDFLAFDWALVVVSQRSGVARIAAGRAVGR